MPVLFINHKFSPGDLVCLKAHTLVPSEGRPQIGSVLAFHAAVDGGGYCIEYAIRWLTESAMQWGRKYRQKSCGPQLFAESELIAYDKSLDEVADEATKDKRSRLAPGALP